MRSGRYNVHQTSLGFSMQAREEKSIHDAFAGIRLIDSINSHDPTI